MVNALSLFSCTCIVMMASSLVQAQEFKFEEPLRLGSQINSEAEEISPLLSPDGKTLYFARMLHHDNEGGKLAGLDIWLSKKGIANEWLPSVNNFKQWNTKSSNVIIGINRANTIVYLLNSYNQKIGIAFSKFIDGKWTDPEIINIPGMNRSEFVGYYMNPGFDILLISMASKDSFGEEDLYVSLKDSSGKWSKPENLGSTINTDGFEISPFLSEDGKKLFFSSNRHKGMGDADIFYSERLYNSWNAWSVPKNLGEKINSNKFDAYFSMYGDSVAYFSSNRNGELADIYKSKLAINTESQDIKKEYLNKDEIKDLFGNIKLEINFDRTSLTLNSSQNEFLFYLVNKILTKQDIKVQLVVNDDITQEQTQKRISAITDKLKSLGISSYRIFTTTNKSTKTVEGLFQINLFR